MAAVFETMAIIFFQNFFCQQMHTKNGDTKIRYEERFVEVAAWAGGSDSLESNNFGMGWVWGCRFLEVRRRFATLNWRDQKEIPHMLEQDSQHAE